MLLPPGTGAGLVDVPVMVGINIVPRVRDAIAGMGVVAKASAAAYRFTGVRVTRNPSGAPVHHSGFSVVGRFPGFSGVISGIGVALAVPPAFHELLPLLPV